MFLGYQGRFAGGTVTVPASTTLSEGTVLGVVTSTGYYAPYNSGASTGVQTPVAVLAQDVTNGTTSAASITGVRLFVQGAVNGNALIFLTAGDTWQKAFVALKANGIVAEHVQNGIEEV
jgi:hypothetical protein